MALRVHLAEPVNHCYYVTRRKEVLPTVQRFMCRISPVRHENIVSWCFF